MYKYCPQCGTPVSSGGRFCSQCGVRFEPHDTANASSQVPQPFHPVSERLPPEVREFTMDVVRDPQLNGLEAFRILLPSGWTGRGDVQWDYQSVASTALISYRAKSVDGKAEVLARSARHYVQKPGLGQIGNFLGQFFGQNVAQAVGTLGGSKYYGYPVMPIPTPEQYAAWSMPQLDSAIQNVQMTSAKPHPRQAQIEPMLAQQGFRFLGNVLDGTCTINGSSKRFRALVALVIQPLPVGGLQIWTDPALNVLIADSDVFDKAGADFELLLANGSLSVPWQQIQAQMMNQLNQTMRNRQDADWAAARQMSAQLSARVDQIIDRNQPKWNSSSSVSSVASDRSDAMDRAAAGWCDHLRDVDTYSLPDGGSVAIPTKYDRAWISPTGDTVLMGPKTFDPPVDFTVLERLR